jgi:hypothetical protein
MGRSTERRFAVEYLFFVWPNGAFVTSATSNFVADLTALVKQYGMPASVEVRVRREVADDPDAW